MVIDILVKLSVAQVDLADKQAAQTAITAYQSDHIRFLPEIQSILQDGADDRVLTRTILQALTQICGPISFNLFAKICHCLVLTKQYIKDNKPAKASQDADALGAAAIATVEDIGDTPYQDLPDNAKKTDQGHAKAPLSTTTE